MLDSDCFDEARELYIRLCELDGSNSDSWAVLGKIHHQLGDHESAVTCLEHAVELNPGDVASLAYLARVLLSSGKMSMASKYCSKAIDAQSHTLELWWELGDISAQLGKFTETERCCRKTIAGDPAFAPAHLYLGIALQRQSRLEEAESALQAALCLRPDFANAYYHLAIVQQSMQKLVEAIQNYRRAMDFGYEPASSLNNMGFALEKQGNLNEALKCRHEALGYEPDNLKYRQNFVRVLRAVAPLHVSSDMLKEIECCFGVTGLDTAALMKPGMILLLQNTQLQQLVRLACNGSEDKIKTGILTGYYRELFQNSLLKALLSYTKIASLEFEQLTGALRKIALNWVSESPDGLPDGLFDDDGSMLFALASQCFNTEYAMFIDPAEAAKVNNLALSFDEQLDPCITDNSALMYQLVVLCMYQPLYSQPWAQVFLELKRPDTGTALYALLKTQLFDRTEELRIRDTIESLTSVRDEVSLAVREQYEDSPYPRWNSVAIHTPVSYRKETGSQFPGFNPPDFGDSGIDVLIAGCGTGRHAIMSATLYKDANVLAIDLSLASLAFGVRKAHELGISNVTFSQADILELGSLNRRFHIIETSGVLHHMDHPETGLQVLVTLLQDGGLIHIGLYSEVARRDVTAARAYIADKGFESTPDGIRLARKSLAELDEDHPAQSVTRFRDYFTLSECRDLLFHAKEQQFRLIDIKKLLDRCNLKFVGFTFSNPRIPVQYKNQFPDDPCMANLGNWAKFEDRHPDTFAEMYQFMCQKV